MSLAAADTLGTLAGALLLASFLPQIIKLWRERTADGVSLRMYLFTVTGFSLWIGYGLLVGSWPVWLSNAVNLVLATTILALKARLGRTGSGRG